MYVRVKRIQEGREVCVKGCVRGRGVCEGYRRMCVKGTQTQIMTIKA